MVYRKRKFDPDTPKLTAMAFTLFGETYQPNQSFDFRKIGIGERLAKSLYNSRRIKDAPVEVKEDVETSESTEKSMVQMTDTERLAQAQAELAEEEAKAKAEEVKEQAQVDETTTEVVDTDKQEEPEVKDQAPEPEAKTEVVPETVVKKPRQPRKPRAKRKAPAKSKEEPKTQAESPSTAQKKPWEK